MTVALVALRHAEQRLVVFPLAAPIGLLDSLTDILGARLAEWDAVDLGELADQVVGARLGHQFDDAAVFELDEARPLRVEGRIRPIRHGQHVDLNPLEGPTAAALFGLETHEHVGIGLLQRPGLTATLTYVSPFGEDRRVVAQSEVLRAAGAHPDLARLARGGVEVVVKGAERLQVARPVHIDDVDLGPARVVTVALLGKRALGLLGDALEFPGRATDAAAVQQRIGHVADPVGTGHLEGLPLDTDLAGMGIAERGVKREFVRRLGHRLLHAVAPVGDEVTHVLEYQVDRGTAERLRDVVRERDRTADALAALPGHEHAGGVGSGDLQAGSRHRRRFEWIGSAVAATKGRGSPAGCGAPVAVGAGRFSHSCLRRRPSRIRCPAASG